MKDNDMDRLKSLNERYSPTNMTAFRLVGDETERSTVLKHIKTDIEILNTTDVRNKCVVRIILRDDVVDICSHDNGTPISYFFTERAGFGPEDIAEDIFMLCDKLDITFDDLRQ